MRGGLRAVLAAALLSSLGAGATRADDERLFVEASTRLSLAQLADFSGATLLAAAQASLPIVPWMLVDLRLGAEFPLRTGKMDADHGITLLALPGLWGRFGDPEAWGYLRLGTGLAGQYGAGGWEAGWVVEAAGGFSVAPRDLLVYFGVEAAGMLGLAGPRVRSVGLGGFIGFPF